MPCLVWGGVPESCFWCGEIYAACIQDLSDTANKKFDMCRALCYTSLQLNKISSGQGDTKVNSRPTVTRTEKSVNCFWQPIRCNSGTDSKVWMREEKSSF